MSSPLKPTLVDRVGDRRNYPASDRRQRTSDRRATYRDPVEYVEWRVTVTTKWNTCTYSVYETAAVWAQEFIQRGQLDGVYPPGEVTKIELIEKGD